MLVAAANPKYAEAAGPATLLVASSVIVTSLLVPPLTALWTHRVDSSEVTLESGEKAEIPINFG
jgi:hypothetical protein